MAYWLFKSEPGAWSWEDQKAAGKAGAEWDGVRNHQASNNMKAMKKGDLGFFYHSVDEKRIVGIVEVSAEAHPDSTDPDAKWMCVDVRAVKDVKTPVTLAEMRAREDLADFALIRQSRLSVVPVTAAQWATITAMAGLKAPPMSKNA